MTKKISKVLLYAVLVIISPALVLFIGIHFNWFGTYQGTGQVIELSQFDPLDFNKEESAKESISRKILFGDLHVHTTYSLDALMLNLPIAGGEGTHPVADACNFARFCSNLDFFAVTDHAEWLTKREWRDSLESIQNCSKVSDNLDESPIVPFLGWEWTQTSINKDTHYGHKNIIIKGIKEEQVPFRPIAANSKQFDAYISSGSLLILSLIHI